MNMRLYKKWWKTWKTFPVFAWVKAAMLYKAGKYHQAIRYYNKGLAKHKTHPARFCARIDLAYCLFREKKFQEAETHLKYVGTHLPKSKEVYMRLARLQLWTGRALDAAWTMRRALRYIKPDAEVLSLFMFAVIDNGGPTFLLKEALDATVKLSKEGQSNQELEATRARLMTMRGNVEKGREYLKKIADSQGAPLEALILYSEFLLKENEIGETRKYLRHAMAIAPEHPRVLSLLAESYLLDGDHYNIDYAKQLATQACQNTNWLSPREMHILAEAYYKQGDKISALIIASKAKEEGSRLLGTYRDSALLDKLIDDLSSGTQA